MASSSPATGFLYDCVQGKGPGLGVKRTGRRTVSKGRVAFAGTVLCSCLPACRAYPSIQLNGARFFLAFSVRYDDIPQDDGIGGIKRDSVVGAV